MNWNDFNMPAFILKYDSMAMVDQFESADQLWSILSRRALDSPEIVQLRDNVYLLFRSH